MRFPFFAALLMAAAGCAPLAPMPLVPPNPDLRSCGLVWDRDQGNLSIWRATRPARIAVGEYNSNGQFVEGPINMSAGDTVSIKMGTQRARCL